MSRKICCIIRNKAVFNTPEELVRQEFIRLLLEDYNYDVQDIKLEYKTKRAPSDKLKSYPVDIAVYENGKIKIFVETKKSGTKPDKGVKQLCNYMALDDDVVWGVWTNGSDKVFLKKVLKDKIVIEEVFDIPQKGFNTFESQILHSDLIKSKNLKSVFKGLRSYIAAHSTGTNRDEKITSELIKIVLCKTYDEKFTTNGRFLSFYHEDGKDAATRKL